MSDPTLLRQLREMKAKAEQRLSRLTNRVDNIDEILIHHGKQLKKISNELGIPEGEPEAQGTARSDA
jgi:hypothetical protein